VIKIRRTMLTASSALALAALLTGCSLASGDVAGLVPSSAPAATDAVASTAPVALAGDRDGNGKLSAFEAEQLAKTAPKDYTMPDGSVVTIDQAQPLPEPVVAVLKAQVTTLAEQIVDYDGADSHDVFDSEMKLFDYVNQQAEATGKKIVAVFSVEGLDPASNEPGTYWTAAASGGEYGNLAPIQGTLDKASAIAQVEAWGVAKGYELIVTD
jgi:hypothetical protein